MLTRFALAHALALVIVSSAFSQDSSEMNRVSVESRGYLMKVYADQGEIPGQAAAMATGSSQLIRNTKGELRILTNNHVVGNAKKVWVQFRGEFAQEVDVLGTDPRADLALLRAPKTLPAYAKPIDFAITPAQIGDKIYAIGYPLGSYNISYGWMTSDTTPIGLRTMTHQAPLTRGNSGGALVRLNDQGRSELVGINTAISNEDGNMSYFVPSAVAQKLLHKMENGPVVHAIMGVGLVDTTEIQPNAYQQITGSPYPPSRKGILVSSVSRSSSAERAGVKVGDMIIKCEAKIGGVWRQMPVGDSSSFSDEVFFNIEPGTRGRVTILRGDKELTLDIEFMAAPPA